MKVLVATLKRSKPVIYQTLPQAKHTMRYLFALLCLVAAVYAVPNVDPELSNTFPTVGEIFGPVNLTRDQGQWWGIDHNSHDIHLQSLTSPDQIFRDVKEMETYVHNSLTDDTAVVKIDLNMLKGKYLEVLWSRMIVQSTLKMICHYPSEKPFFCHHPGRQVKLTYSMVRLLDDNTVFPVVFLNHKACLPWFWCYWISHPVELAVVDKSII